jgi:hypothetical protein
MDHTIGDRIRQGCQALTMTISGLARSVPMRRQHLQLILDGSIQRSKSIPTIARILGCDATWLATGLGHHPGWWPTKRTAPAAPPAPGAAVPGDGGQDPRDAIIAEQAVEIRRLRMALARAKEEMIQARNIALLKTQDATQAMNEVQRLREPAGTYRERRRPTGSAG